MTTRDNLRRVAPILLTLIVALLCPVQVSYLCLQDVMAEAVSGDGVSTGVEPATISNTGPVIIDGPWDSLPPCAEAGIAYDSDWKALTLSSDMTHLVFVAEPAPEKDAFVNHIWDIGAYDGRVYIGYGDQQHNQGPVDILSYDPLSGVVASEMHNIPEEAVGLWHTSPDGRTMCASGLDTQEQGNFGSFYVDYGSGWRKRGTIYDGTHVREVVGFEDRLYTCNGLHPYTEPFPPDYPHVTTSCNNGATWSREQIGEETPQFEYGLFDCDTVTHRLETAGGGVEEVPYLYTILSQRVTGSSQRSAWILYRLHGGVWERVYLPSTVGANLTWELISRPNLMFVVARGSYGNGGAQARVYALDGGAQEEVEVLRGREPLVLKRNSWGLFTHDGWYYFIEDVQSDGMDPGYVLYGSLNLHAPRWRSLGNVPLPTGVDIVSYAIVHGRLYVGVANALRKYLGGHDMEVWEGEFVDLAGATLRWDADVPDGARLSFQIWTGATTDATFIGPDGTGDTFFTVSGQAVPPQVKSKNLNREAIRIFRMANDQGELPYVRSVTLDTGTGPVVSMAVDEGQGLYAAANSTDPDGAVYLSPIYRLEQPALDGALSFESATPGNTSLRFQLRSGLTQERLEQTPFVGPDGSPDTFYCSTGGKLWTGHNNDLFIQYRAVLASTKPTVAPYLRKVILVTRADRLDHFDVQWDDSTAWVSGKSCPLTVTARSADGNLVPIEGLVSLSAVDASTDEILKIEPAEIRLSGGVGLVNVSLGKATPTEFHAELADVRSCSRTIDVQPGVAYAIEITTDLVVPVERPHDSPVGHRGQPFTLCLRILDRSHNTVTGYTGTVSVERWSWTCESPLLPPYTFQASDEGYHQFVDCVQIEEGGGWNIVGSDKADPRVAGSLTVLIQ